MENRAASKRNNAVRILEYWYAMEFLAQDPFPNCRERRDRIEKYKRTRKIPNMVTDALAIKPGETGQSIYQLIRKEACDFQMSRWGNITVYVGRVRREDCIELLSRMLPGEKDEETAIRAFPTIIIRMI